jgi:hypothetical protein
MVMQAENQKRIKRAESLKMTTSVLPQESPPSETASASARLQNDSKVIIINDPYQSVAKKIISFRHVQLMKKALFICRCKS